jgi:hypothetical protein
LLSQIRQVLRHRPGIAGLTWPHSLYMACPNGTAVAKPLSALDLRLSEFLS